MSDDPVRFLDERGPATDLERDLLRSGGDVEPPASAHDAVWASLQARLPAGDGSGGGSAGGDGGLDGTGAGATSSFAGLAKGVAALVVAGVLVGGAVHQLRSPSNGPAAIPTSPGSATLVVPAVVDTPSAAAANGHASPLERVAPQGSIPAPTTDRQPPSSKRPSASSPRALASVAEPAPPTQLPAAASSAAIAPSATLDALREESALLAAARAAVRRGDSRAALTDLEIARSRFPNGALLQEREVLTIEALAQNGQSEEASRRAAAFLRAFPSTPHAARVRAFVR